jgi:hypothetical protein
MFEKYITIKERKIICGQTSTGTWYCKELPAETTSELKMLIGEINQILNQYNNNKEKKSSNSLPKKEKKT